MQFSINQKLKTSLKYVSNLFQQKYKLRWLKMLKFDISVLEKFRPVKLLGLYWIEKFILRLSSLLEVKMHLSLKYSWALKFNNMHFVTKYHYRFILIFTCSLSSTEGGKCKWMISVT